MNLLSRRRVLSDLPALLKNPRASRERIVAFQERRLRDLVAHAYERVPYYRDLFNRERIKPADIRTLADLRLIPATSKSTLQSLDVKDVIASGADARRLVVRKTTGTTGLPLTMYRNRAESAAIVAMVWRVRKEFGVRSRDKVISLAWKRPDSETGGPAKKRGTIRRAVGIPAWTKINCIRPMEEIADALRHEQPDVILGYAGVLGRLAEFLGDDARDIRPRLVVSVSEALTSVARTRIERAFATTVRDVYAAWELGLMAYECRMGGTYHTCDDNVILEVRRRDGGCAGEGESGEVIGTSLHYAAMPFIRYEIGDVATRGPDRCACGSPFHTLRAIDGRTQDYFRLPDGRLLHPMEITSIIR
ncbi:MAG: hypothetical protein ABI556_10270, partial [Gemmatimonadales bacterium]